MIKLAGMEDPGVSDPKTGRKIRISTTVRIIYRKAYPDRYGHMRNEVLNDIIAKEFAGSAGSVMHYFKMGKDHHGKNVIAEIRGSSSFYFISGIWGEYIDVFTIQSSWIKPKYKAVSNHRELETE